MSSGKSLFLENVFSPRFEIKVSSKGQESTYICNCLKKREQKAGIIGKMFWVNFPNNFYEDLYCVLKTSWSYTSAVKQSSWLVMFNCSSPKKNFPNWMNEQKNVEQCKKVWRFGYWHKISRLQIYILMEIELAMLKGRGGKGSSCNYLTR